MLRLAFLSSDPSIDARAEKIFLEKRLKTPSRSLTKNIPLQNTSVNHDLTCPISVLFRQILITLAYELWYYETSEAEDETSQKDESVIRERNDSDSAEKRRDEHRK
jgi:hypothetical protein